MFQMTLLLLLLLLRYAQTFTFLIFYFDLYTPSLSITDNVELTRLSGSLLVYYFAVVYFSLYFMLSATTF